jgi:hypothetical protein
MLSRLRVCLLWLGGEVDERTAQSRELEPGHLLLSQFRVSIGHQVFRCEHAATWVWNRDIARSDRLPRQYRMFS